MQFNQHLNELQLEVVIVATSGLGKSAPEEYNLHLKDCEQCLDLLFKMIAKIRGQCIEVKQLLPMLKSSTSPVLDEERLMATRHLSLCGDCWKMYERIEEQDNKIFQGEKL